MKISIIITVFNLEIYIKKCIDSFINQDVPHNDYELIIVDDGSIDNSTEIIKNYSQKNINIKYYAKSNGGASSARNYGLQFAKGEYVWFFDGDDWIKPNILGKVINYIDKYKSDIIFLNYEYINEQDLLIYKTFFSYSNETIFSGYELFNIAPGDFIMPHRFIIKKDVIINNNITFIEGITFEDDEWAPRLLYYSNKCICIKEPIYYYLKRDTSLMASFNVRKIPSFLKVIESLKFFRDNNVKNIIFKKRLNKYILTYISNYLRYRESRYIKGFNDINEIKRINPISAHGLSPSKVLQYLFIKYIPYIYSKIFAIK